MNSLKNFGIHFFITAETRIEENWKKKQEFRESIIERIAEAISEELQ